MNTNNRRQAKGLQAPQYHFTKPQENRAWALEWDAEALAALSKKRGLYKNGTDPNREDSFSSHR